jgi:hypothetical protein
MRRRLGPKPSGNLGIVIKPAPIAMPPAPAGSIQERSENRSGWGAVGTELADAGGPDIGEPPIGGRILAKPGGKLRIAAKAVQTAFAGELLTDEAGNPAGPRGRLAKPLRRERGHLWEGAAPFAHQFHDVGSNLGGA